MKLEVSYMRKQIIAFVLAITLLAALSACSGEQGKISVQRADQLALSGQAQERYAGKVVSENVVNIQKDSQKTILEVYVTEGQKVSSGDKLFTYDSEALQLDLEKLQLEVEKMGNERETYTDQLADLQNELDNTWNDSAIVRLTLEINTLKTKLLEIDYQLKAKEKEIAKNQEMLDNIDITAPVDGTIRKVDEESETGPYITIQQNGAFQVKGRLNEMSMSNGLMMGARVKVISRLDSNKTWMGTVVKVDMEGNSQEGEATPPWMGGGAANDMSSTSSYPFYVELDSTDGLLLGQHVYMEVASNEEEVVGLWIPSLYLTDITQNGESGEQTAKVLVADSHGKLVEKPVVLGMMNEMNGCYEILSGLNPEDYVADPTAPGSHAGAAVEYRNETDFGGEVSDETVPEETTGETDGGEELPEETSEEPTAEPAADPTAEPSAEPTDETAAEAS